MNHQLAISGLVPFSATDYPGQLSAVIFCQGCPWQCRYCHNPHLQPFGEGAFAWDLFEKFLLERRGLLDAIVFSGGEATAQPALAAAMQLCKAQGYSVGLHTAGYCTARLEDVLPYCNWVGLDIKAMPANYGDITGIATSAPFDSLRALLASGVAYEIRTTFHPVLMAEKDLLQLAKLLQAEGVTNYAVQLFQPEGCGARQLTSNGANLSRETEEKLRSMFSVFTLRR